MEDKNEKNSIFRLFRLRPSNLGLLGDPLQTRRAKKKRAQKAPVAWKHAVSWDANLSAATWAFDPPPLGVRRAQF